MQQLLNRRSKQTRNTELLRLVPEEELNVYHMFVTRVSHAYDMASDLLV